MALLQDDFWLAIFHDDAGRETITDAYSVASHPVRIASCFFELEKVNQDLQYKLNDDFNNILNSMGGLSLSSSSQPACPSISVPTRTISTHNISFTIAAYSWLLENIANPYPSSTIKVSLAQQHSIPLSTINSWFVSARRRMGWTALCRDYFDNCRADALDAAYRALVKEDPNRQLPTDIIHAFISMKVVAEGLYSSIPTKSAFANDLETVVKVMSDQDNVLANEQKRYEPKGTVESSKVLDTDLQNQKLMAQGYCPSPDHSPSSSSVPALDESLADESEDDEDILPSTVAGRKRRFSSSEAARAPMLESATRFVKRSRSSCSSVNTYLPCPATNVEELIETDQMLWPASTAQNFTDVKIRERRLSDTGTIRSPKCPQYSVVGSRPHAVSDPLSTLESEVSINEWFKTNFDALFTLPPPADVAEPDLSAQWEIELFNNYIIPENPQMVLTSPIRDNQVLSSADLVTLSELLRSLEKGGFGALPETSPPATASVLDPVSQGLPLLPDLSQTINWAALLNENPSEPTNDPIFPQCYVNSTLPEIDLSVL